MLDLSKIAAELVREVENKFVLLVLTAPFLGYGVFAR